LTGASTNLPGKEVMIAFRMPAGPLRAEGKTKCIPKRHCFIITEEKRITGERT